MKDISILITGQAGQGIKTVEMLLADLFLSEGFYVFATKEYMSRVRGGANSTELRISSKPVRAPLDRVDILLALDRRILNRIAERVKGKTLVIGQLLQKNIAGAKEHVDFLSIAEKIGSPVFSNVVATGTILAILKIGRAAPERHLKRLFKNKGSEVIKKNLAALCKGYDIGEAILKKNRFSYTLSKGGSKNALINGTQAIGLGALAGGCNFISAYPMSPSTGVFTFLAGMRASNKNLIAEQAEDEISAINMALGASYAGAKSLANTSGGGFALMEEGVSLAGMAEIPLVVHLAQRPGPATGLPTRTEQADLNLALYAGHGEFPRIIFAPGSIEDAFKIAQKAFYLADRYQIPVFILTDQYFLDSYYNAAPPAREGEMKKNTDYVIKTKKSYKRYSFTKNGISPRGIPGWGNGFICIDSDEHDESGHITEDMQTRKKMADKRWKKMSLIEKEIIHPEFYGDKEYDMLVIGWGSTYHIIKEAVDRTGKKGLGFLHFSQVYPLSKKTKAYLSKAKKIVTIENNFKGQFADLIKTSTGFDIKHRITKYTGLSFSVEEIEAGLKKKLAEGKNAKK